MAEEPIRVRKWFTMAAPGRELIIQLTRTPEGDDVARLRAGVRAFTWAIQQFNTGDPGRRHNEAVAPLMQHIVEAVGVEPQHLNVMAESLLLGVALLNFPEDPRRQALIIQEIADAAADRATARGRANG